MIHVVWVCEGRRSVMALWQTERQRQTDDFTDRQWRIVVAVRYIEYNKKCSLKIQ